jgi:hypothetical protein
MFEMHNFNHIGKVPFAMCSNLFTDSRIKGVDTFEDFLA